MGRQEGKHFRQREQQEVENAPCSRSPTTARRNQGGEGVVDEVRKGRWAQGREPGTLGSDFFTLGRLIP